MDQKIALFVCILVVLYGSQSMNTSKLDSLIFGDLWKFNEYCGEYHNATTIKQEDEQTELYLNGSLYSSIDGDTIESAVSKLDQLNYISIRARSSTSILCSINSWGYVDESDFRLSNEPHENQIECNKDLDHLIRSVILLLNLNQNTNTSKTSTFDMDTWSQFQSFGRAPAGLHSKNDLWPGDFDACLRLPKRRYCLGAFQKFDWPSNHLKDSFKVGLCLPRSCNSRMLTQAQMERLDFITRKNFDDLLSESGYRLAGLYCPPADDSVFRSFTKDYYSVCLLLLASIWLCLLALVSVYSEHPKLSQLRDHFNLVENWSKLTSSKHLDERLVGLNAIKVITMCWLMVSHILVLYMSHTVDLLEVRANLRQSAVGMAILLSTFAVPCFFLVSGFLLGFKHLAPGALKPRLGRLLLDRYIRLVPMYLVVYVYVKQFAHITGDGPLWDYGVSAQSEARQCRLEPWPMALLLLANFSFPFSSCIITSWHIANDLHANLLLGPLLLLYQRQRRLGRYLCLASFVASHCYQAWNFSAPQALYSSSQLVTEPVALGSRIIMDRVGYGYVNPFARLGTYLAGVLLADLVHASRPTSPSTSAGSLKGPSITSAASQSNRSKVTHKRLQWFTDGQTNLRLAVAGLSLLVASILMVLLPHKLKASLVSIFGSLSYPLCRLGAELGWFLLLYGLFSAPRVVQAARQVVEVGVKVKAKGGAIEEEVGGGGVVLIRESAKDENKTESLAKVENEVEVEGSSTSRNVNSSHLASQSSFLRSPIWNLIGKLNYGVMLAHFTLFRNVIQSQRQLIQFTWFNYLQCATFLVLASYILSGLLHLTIELPLASIARSLTSSPSPPPTTTTAPAAS